MKRSPLRRKLPPKREATQSTYTPRPRAVARPMTLAEQVADAQREVASWSEKRKSAQLEGDDGRFKPRPKSAPWRSEPYRRLVAALPCIRCRIEGYSQAAHADYGKGMATKTGDETCYPLCGPRVGEPGCHEHVGRVLARENRRSLEAGWGRLTRSRLRAAAEVAGIALPVEPE